jgi:hypothetical protein
MENDRISLGQLKVQTFTVDPEPVQPSVPTEPVGYETDDAHQSICFVSCGGSCRGC